MESMTHILVDRMVLFYHLTMTWQEVWGILKWVLAALAAGFVGQFGKSLALILMKRRRSRRAREAEQRPLHPTADGSASNSDFVKSAVETHAKIEKKRAKAEVKRLKKF
jgi:biopolymer transport protein ExbB/TolQ